MFVTFLTHHVTKTSINHSVLYCALWTFETKEIPLPNKICFTPRDLFLFSKWSLLCLCHGLLVGWFGIIIILIKCLGLLFGCVFQQNNDWGHLYVSESQKQKCPKLFGNCWMEIVWTFSSCENSSFSFKSWLLLFNQNMFNSDTTLNWIRLGATKSRCHMKFAELFLESLECQFNHTQKKNSKRTITTNISVAFHNPSIWSIDNLSFQRGSRI